MKQHTIVVNLVLVTIVWVTSCFNFYMVNFQVKYFPGSFEVNTLVMTASDLPATILAGILTYNFSPRRVYVLFAGLASIAGLGILFLVDGDNPGYKLPVLCSCARVGTMGLFTSAWITHPRMFPTLFAVTSIGISNFCCRGLVIAAPLVAEIEHPVPMIVFTTLSIICCTTSMFIIDGDKLKLLENLQTTKENKAN